MITKRDWIPPVSSTGQANVLHGNDGTFIFLTLYESQVMSYLRPYLTLCRLTVSVFAAASAATGFFLVPPYRITGLFGTSFAVFLLSCGASALNQYQERSLDAGMERTRKRPLPSGIITPPQAMVFSLALILAGLALLAYAGGAKAAFLGLFALVWYNGLYTYLKKMTAFAAVPGAVVGMVPPAIGWVSAGGALFDPRIAAVCFIFFMWQIPHFWLLLLDHAEEYEQAGLPSLTRVMSRPQIGRVTFAWIVAAAIAGLSLPLYGSIRSPLAYMLLIPGAGWLIWSGKTLTGGKTDGPLFSVLFKRINIYLLFVMSLLSLENIFFPNP
jgi:protoheme IX farnesyltransferase